jgi:transcriptional regulator with XRE-family HTH domain
VATAILSRMDDRRVGQALRAIRMRRRLRQSDVAALAGVSRRAIGELERGLLANQRLEVLRAVAVTLDATIDLGIRWNGADLDRLLSSGHAALHEALGAFLRTFPGWESFTEVTFAIYGERGVIDILAWHAPSRSLLIIELKTALGDPQALTATMDRRIRLARRIAAERGWDPLTISSWVVFAESPTNRRHVAAHAVLLRGRWPEGGREMRAWLENPRGTIHALSVFSDVRRGNRIGATVTPRRVRRRAAERGSDAGAAS